MILQHEAAARAEPTARGTCTGSDGKVSGLWVILFLAKVSGLWVILFLAGALWVCLYCTSECCNRMHIDCNAVTMCYPFECLVIF